MRWTHVITAITLGLNTVDLQVGPSNQTHIAVALASYRLTMDTQELYTCSFAQLKRHSARCISTENTENETQIYSYIYSMCGSLHVCLCKGCVERERGVSRDYCGCWSAIIPPPVSLSLISVVSAW